MKILITILMFTPFLCVNAQESTLRGRIISEYFEDIPGVKISNLKNELLGITDIEGRFEITFTNEISMLNISYIGMEPTIIELSTNCDCIEVIMMFEANYDYKSLSKVNRLRMKRFKKLPGLHEEAFVTGIFKTEKACYIQKFTPCNKQNKTDI